jgi:hypothetical protein
MKTLKLKVMGRFGSEMAMNPDEIFISFPYMGNRTLVKMLSKGHVRLLDKAKGELEVEIDDFEEQGLNTGERQSFVATIVEGIKKTVVTFTAGLNVDTIDDRKSIR